MMVDGKEAGGNTLDITSFTQGLDEREGETSAITVLFLS